MDAGRIVALHRFPVKSMQGEQLDDAAFDDRGVVGDRAYALVDRSDGRVATAKHPHKWRRLLDLRATYTEAPSHAPQLGHIRVEFPDGASYAGDAPALSGALQRHLGRDVELVVGLRPDARGEMVWPDIEGLAPRAVVDAVVTGESEGGERLGDLPLAAETGTFVDWAPVHLLTTSTLRALAGHEPDTAFDPRRFRPNVLLDTTAEGFVENDWPGATLTSEAGVALRVTLPTVRCVMTTLAQGDLPDDRRTLRTLARVNRLDVPEFGGAWACAGAYASVAAPGTLRTGQPLVVARP
jgi:uncharacterized protein